MNLYSLFDYNFFCCCFKRNRFGIVYFAWDDALFVTTQFVNSIFVIEHILLMSATNAHFFLFIYLTCWHFSSVFFFGSWIFFVFLVLHEKHWNQTYGKEKTFIFYKIEIEIQFVHLNDHITLLERVNKKKLKLSSCLN